MKLEEQVVSLDLAKRLKELGVKQESIFVLYTNADSAHLLYLGDDGMRPMEAKTYSAFTVAELGEMLPRFYETHRTNGILPEIEWTCASPYNVEHQIGSTEADARAKMLIYLLENNLIN